jgi:hypothetical protein
MHRAQSQRTLTEGSRPPFEAGRKMGVVAKALRWPRLPEDPQCASRGLLDKVAQTPSPIGGSVRHLNRLRVHWPLNRRKGRPRHAAGGPLVASGTALVQVTPRLSWGGGHRFAPGLEQHQALGSVVTQRQPASEAPKRAWPDDDFALLHHRVQPLRRRFAAWFFAPWLGIDTLTAVATHAQPLHTLLGRSAHSTTLRQCLGPLERLDAAQAWMPTLWPPPAGHLPSVDGPMIASGRRLSRPTGTIPMLGRLMTGSHAIIAQREPGHGLFGEDHPPAIHLSQVMVAYGQQGAVAPGSALCVIDRAVNAVAMACAFDQQGLGLLCLLDDNEQQGRPSCEATLGDTLEDGTKG